MAQTYSSLQLEALGGPNADFDSATYLARTQQWINDAIHEIARRAHVPALDRFTATAYPAGGAGVIPTLPADFMRVHDVFNLADGVRLTEITADEITQRLVQSNFQTGVAVHFAIVRNTPSDTQFTLGVFPLPAAATTYAVAYQANATSLLNPSDGLDTAAIPDEYAHMIVCFVRARLFRAEDDYEAANVWLAEFERQLVHLRADLQRQSPLKTRQINPRRRGYRGFSSFFGPR